MLRRRLLLSLSLSSLALMVSLALVATNALAAEPPAAPKDHASEKSVAGEPPAVNRSAVDKTAEKLKAGSEGQPEKKAPGKPGDVTVVEKRSPEAKEGQNVDRLAAKLAQDASNANKAKKALGPTVNDLSNSVEEPESQPPPLKVAALKDELKRHADGADHPGPRGDRQSLAKMAAEVNQARESLREDTARMEALLAGADAATDGNEAEGGKKAPAPLDVVAKAMRGMKPDQAAPIVTHMERKLAADILRHMPPADAGKVMAFLKPELAAELAAEIALRVAHPERKR